MSTPTLERTGTFLNRRKKPARGEGDLAERGGLVWTTTAWVITLVFFAPVAWMVLTSFHSEADAATNPPTIFAGLTFDNYSALFDRGVGPFLINSATASIVSTLLVLAWRSRRRTRCRSSRWRSGRT